MSKDHAFKCKLLHLLDLCPATNFSLNWALNRMLSWLKENVVPRYAGEGRYRPHGLERGAQNLGSRMWRKERLVEGVGLARPDIGAAKTETTPRCHAYFCSCAAADMAHMR